MTARRNRDSRDPSIKTEERNSLVSADEMIWLCASVLSMTTSPLSNFTLAPSSLKICAIQNTSEIAGVSRIVTCLSVNTDAAKSGRTAFFADWTFTSPNSRRPPSMIYLSMVISLCISEKRGKRAFSKVGPRFIVLFYEETTAACASKRRIRPPSPSS